MVYLFKTLARILIISLLCTSFQVHANPESSCRTKRTNIEIFGIPRKSAHDPTYHEHLQELQESVLDIKDTFRNQSNPKDPFGYLRNLRVDDRSKNDDFPDPPLEYWKLEVALLEIIRPYFVGSGEQTKMRLRVHFGNSCESSRRCDLRRDTSFLLGAGEDRRMYYETLLLYALALNARDERCDEVVKDYARRIEDNIKKLNFTLEHPPELAKIRKELQDYIPKMGESSEDVERSLY